MSPRLPVVALVGGAVLLALFALPPLYLRGTDESALYDGDEAVYAQMAREMVRDGRPSELSFDGELLFPRPPGAFWPIAALYALRGDTPPEPAVRWANAGLCALCVALTILLGARLVSPLVGITAGGLLACSDLFVGYARVYESEPLLACCVLLAFYGWALKSRAGWILFGVGLGGALLTKQIVGALPLGAPIAELIAARLRRDPRPSARGPLLGLAVGLVVALPWHVLMIARHGRAFVEPFFVRTLFGRAQSAMHHRTAATFYFHELFGSEGGPFAIFFLAASAAVLLVGLWRGRAAALVLGGWALGVLAIYSLPASRFDYYLLLAYPAFALCAAWCVAVVPAKPARPIFAVVLVALSAWLHLPRNLTTLRGDEETRALLAKITPPANATIYTMGRQPYTAKVYGDRKVGVFVESQRDLDASVTVHATGVPAPAVLASPPSAAIELAQRPALLIYPKARADVLAGVAPDRYQIVGETARLRLLSLP